MERRTEKSTKQVNNGPKRHETSRYQGKTEINSPASYFWTEFLLRYCLSNFQRKIVYMRNAFFFILILALRQNMKKQTWSSATAASLLSIKNS